MSFRGDLSKFSTKAQARVGFVFVLSVQMLYGSIVEGSPITSAPGQPVDTGNLRASWQIVWQNKGMSALIVTKVEYAPYVEEGIGMTLRSEVGGFHSLKLTVAGAYRIVAVANSEIEQ